MIKATESRPQVKVLIVDDSAFMRAALSRMIGSEPDLMVAGTASNGTEALEKIVTLNPDVVTLDVEMPGLNGLETLRCIMIQCPRPVIMVSSVTVKDAEMTFNALGAGAFDYIPKQLSSTSLDIMHIRHDLISKIKLAAQSRRSHPANPILRKPPQSVEFADPEALPVTPMIVAIGTSTGGPRALQEILPLFPKDFPLPILVVQHMPAGFTAPFAQRLNTLCSIPVYEAADRTVAKAGTVYIAPAGVHMIVDRTSDSRTIICLTPHPEDHLHIPSVDVMMESVASSFRNRSLGVIMTGMGSDGAIGMKAIHRAGGFTIGQDEATSIVYGMPRACAELGILHRIVPLSQIPRQIMLATRYRQRA